MRNFYKPSSTDKPRQFKWGWEEKAALAVVTIWLIAEFAAVFYFNL